MNSLDEQSYRFPMLWLIVGVVAVLIAFSAYFKIDQSVRAQGVVVAGARTQVVQASDGGMLTALHVKEGARVKAGEVLAELEPDRAQAIYSQSFSELASRRIALVRASAELIGKVPVYTNSDRQEWPEFVEAQLGIYKQRKQGLDAEVSVINASRSLAINELNMTRRLYKSGDISETEVMRAERQVLDLRARLDGVKNKYFQDTRLEVAKLEEELSSGKYKLDERAVGLEHTVLKSPMNGIVKLLRINTVGGVLKAGDELMQISPADDDFFVQLKVNPADVGQLRLELPVTLRFDAYDSSIFGSVPGVLRYVSPDTINEQGPNGQAQIFYRAEVSVNWHSTSSKALRISPEDIKSGLTVTADVLTDERSILYFLAKPIVKAFSGAMSQR